MTEKEQVYLQVVEEVVTNLITLVEGVKEEMSPKEAYIHVLTEGYDIVRHQFPEGQAEIISLSHNGEITHATHIYVEKDEIKHMQLTREEIERMMKKNGSKKS